MVKEVFIVGLGGALGSILRYGISVLFTVLALPVPLATLVVNIMGSFAIGIVISVFDKGSLYLFTAVGLCGGFTTFSAFSAHTIDLFANAKYLTALLYVFSTLLSCLLFVALGLFVGSKLFK